MQLFGYHHRALKGLEKAGAAGISADKATILSLEGTNEAESEEPVYEGSMELQYAENFSVDYYEGGYRMLKTMDGTELFIVPEEKEILSEVITAAGIPCRI